MLTKSFSSVQQVETPVASMRTVAQVLFEAGFFQNTALCAGAGLCGQCAVRFLEDSPPPCSADSSRFTASELDAGWRLACRHTASRSWRLEVVVRPQSSALPSHVPCPCLGIDLGTTRIKWSAGSPGLAGKEEAAINPQMAAGSEIMSRLAYAASGQGARERLHCLVADFVEAVAKSVQARNIAVSGHTAMIAFLLHKPLDGLAYAPYRISWYGGSMVALRDGLPDIYIPPMLGPFIGADISAGLGHLCWRSEVRYPFIFADLGTNGEFVLAVSERDFWATSVPMGPAIEGVGLLCGSPAGAGAISQFELTPHGLSWSTDIPAAAISGTGYVSLLALLRRMGMVSLDGHFSDPASPLARKIGAIRASAWGKTLAITDTVWLAERDIEEFLKVKAGVNRAIDALLHAANLALHDIASVYVAGALGEHIATRDLCALGFFPAVFETKVEMVGNTSLAGAFRASYDIRFREWLAQLPMHTHLVSLVDQPDFAAQYVQAMRFAWV
ncbi:ASKHA domain-containing protein [Desulfovibrionales bacterium]